MNTPNFELDSDTQSLLKKSLRTTSTDFTERLMQRILFAEPIKVKSLKSLKYAWISSLFSLLILPFVIYFFVENLQFVFPYLYQYLAPKMAIITPAIVLAFMLLVLLRIEQMIQLSFNRNKLVQRFD